MQPPKKFVCRAVISACLLLCCCFVYAQKTIHFENITFEEAMQKAKLKKKIIFVDVRNSNTNAFTEKVEKEVFTLDSVVNYFNKHCICIRVNMASDEGKKFAPRLAMLMYPVYVFHSHAGDQLDFVNAGAVSKDPGVLMSKARSSLATDKIKNANTRSIVFTNGTWPEILQKAKAESKLVFLDAQTTWCRPCIMMARDVFTLDRVADYYNEHFINVTMDMEKGEGPKLVKEYGVKAYPTFLYIDGDGRLVHQDGGYQEADQFLQVGKAAVGKQTDKKVAVDDSGIQFTPGSWASLLALAKREGKLLFVDANTSWCGPCKQMRKDIFPQPAVAALYNRNFINVDLDMEKGEGVDVKRKYGVNAYPTFLYINGDGEVVHRTVGSCEESAFRQHALDAMSPSRNLLYLAKAYSTYKGDEEMVTHYLAVLKEANEDVRADSVAVSFLLSEEPAAWKGTNGWRILNDYVIDATAEPFRALVNGQDSYAKRYGSAIVENKIYQTYLAWPRHYLSYPENGQALLDRAGFDVFIGQVRSSTYAHKAEIEGRSKLTIYFGLKEWPKYCEVVKGMLSDRVLPMNVSGSETIYSFADIIYRFGGNDEQVLGEAIRWARMISYDINDIRPSEKASYLDLYASLLEKAGQTNLALQVRKEINQQQLAASKESAPFKALIRIAPKQN